MGSPLITQERSVTAGQQFTGTEFSVSPTRPGSVLRLEELDLKMGPENKSWQIQKVTKGGLVLIIAQSIDATGAPAANADTDILVTGPDVAVVLEPGDQIQVVTAAATSAMRAKVYLSERRVSDLAL